MIINRKNSTSKRIMCFVIVEILFIGCSILPCISGITLREDAVSPLSSVQLIITDDGSGDSTDMNVNVPAYIPGSGNTPVLNVTFTILGTFSSGERQYYGDDSWENWKNITISGDILYSVNETTLVHVINGDWIAYITPTKPGGTITLAINWPGSDNGSANQTINIINGTNVVSEIESYNFGKDVNITIVVKDYVDRIQEYADVYLIWEEQNNQFNKTQGNAASGKGANGQYTFWIKTDEQGMIPNHITIAAKTPGTTYWGYAKIDPVVTQTKLNVTLTGGFSLVLSVKNIGIINAKNVTWNITFKGGFILRPWGGYIDNSDGALNIAIGESLPLKYLIFGFGRTDIFAKVQADNAPLVQTNLKAFIFGPFVKLK